MLHFNEVELQHQLKSYLELKLEDFQSQLHREQESLKYSQQWTKENLERSEKWCELLQMKVNFYQTQLDNLK